MEQFAERLLQQQHAFMEKILKEQKEWMMECRNGVNNDLQTGGVVVPVYKRFVKSEQQWCTYIAQLEQHFMAYGVVDDIKKRAYFLSWVGSEIYELLIKLCGSEKPESQTYQSLIDQLTKHFDSKTHILAERYKFHKKKMADGQTYSEWIAELRGIARKCKFICRKEECKEEFVDDLIRDVVILNTPHETVRAAALQKPNPTLEEVLGIAAAYEATQKTVKTIASDCTMPEINQIRRKASSGGENRNFRFSKCQNKVTRQSCSGCGISHNVNECKFRDAKCYKCFKTGHIAPVCKRNFEADKMSRPNCNQRRKSVNQVQHQVHTVVLEAKRFGNRFMINLQINSIPLNFQIDTGATCSMIGLRGYRQLGSPPCSRSDLTLNAYGNLPIKVLGKIVVSVSMLNGIKNLSLLVTDMEEGANILGVDWLDELNLSIGPHTAAVCVVQGMQQEKVRELREKFSEVFEPSLGKCTTLKARLYLKADAKPKFCKPRPIPFTLYEEFRKEASRLEAASIWRRVKVSDWASPIVLVRKRNGNLRICGDFKATVNAQLLIDRHPIPRVDDLMLKLRGGQKFSTIDLSDAYLQIELDEASKKIMVVNTPLGLFEYQRLPFGVASAPAIFQRLVEHIVADIPHCANYLDDIIVTGNNDQEHYENLANVFKRLQEHGLRCRFNKCHFMESQVEYLGYTIGADGIRPSNSGTEAIRNLPRPKNLKQLESLIGKINYYHKFINNYSQICAPLNALKKKGVPFSWESKQEAAFNALKEAIINTTQLSHYSNDYPVILATDASDYGIGAVLSHIYPDGTERPIAYASKTLDVHQQKYSMVEKEALAIVFGVKKFNQYLYGRRFILFTDHQPLITIFHPSKNLPTMVSHRLQRWALVLMGYNYEIRYRNTARNANADALSRLPSGIDKEFDVEYSMQVDSGAEDVINDLPLNAKVIADESKCDKLLGKVIEYVSKGWPRKLPTSEKRLMTFFHLRLALSILEGVLILSGHEDRVVIPSSLKQRVLKLLHRGHWGMVRTKQLARKHCWWPGICKDIEQLVKQCNICQTNGSSQPREFQPWPKAVEPWERVHLDFAGPFFGEMWLLCIDAYSRFPFVVKMGNMTSASSIKALKAIFAIEGFPRTIVTDNGTQFSSREFKQFCSGSGIVHLTTAPFHPASNGLAERFVRSFKSSFSKAIVSGSNKEDAVLTFLISYRGTPFPGSLKTPAELLHGRPCRNLLSILLPAPKRTKLLTTTDRKMYEIGQKVFAKNYAKREPWLPGIIHKRIGQMMYIVRAKGQYWKRHLNQLKNRGVDCLSEETLEYPVQVENEKTQIELEEIVPVDNNIASSNPNDSSSDCREQSYRNLQDTTSKLQQTEGETDSSKLPQVDSEHVQVRVDRPRRIRRPVIRFDPSAYSSLKGGK